MGDAFKIMWPTHLFLFFCSFLVVKTGEKTKRKPDKITTMS